MEEVVVRVAKRIQREGLTPGEAAAMIGVTASSLRRHLDGRYVRSDSLAKYRAWLNGKSLASAVPLPMKISEVSHPDEDSNDAVLLPEAPVRDSPVFVVDLFSGCGGMSLGFDVFDGGGWFETVLAVDVEDAMLTVFNANRSPSPWPLARKADLAEFLNEAEVLAWFLDHLAHLRDDEALAEELDRIPGGGVSRLRAELASIDALWGVGLRQLRTADDHRQALSLVDPASFRQTSVLQFHRNLGVPLPREHRVSVDRLWAGGTPIGSPREPSFESLWRAEAEWDGRVADLRDKTRSSGGGQLASSAGKIADFFRYLDSRAGDALRGLWVNWSAARFDARESAMTCALPTLRSLYKSGRQVGVLLGGPPCQGFSRIGRGKLRSLREHGVHARVDGEVGDERNRLLEAYVLWVSALEPEVFLFENVRHFQAEVKTPAGTFHASEALADSIRDVSERGLDYLASTRIIRADDHGIPQTRERFFMAGVRGDLADRVPIAKVPSWVLHLEWKPSVPLRTALEGLPEPNMFRAGHVVDLAVPVTPALRPNAYDGAEGEYLTWVRSRGPQDCDETVDAHVARPPREDDGAFFALMGPGKRWMDYRADDAPTVKALASVLHTVWNALEALDPSVEVNAQPSLGWLAKLDRDEVRRLLAAVDGSLSIRLMLEQIPPQPGELNHHLLTPNYLAKREGNHGDWVARLDAARPCKTIVSHMGKDTYMYVHPWSPRTISVREAARIQSFPDWFRFGSVGFVDAFRIVGNAVPPMLSHKLAGNVARIIAYR